MNRMETCVESDVTSSGVGEVSRCMSPVTSVIDLAGGGQGRAVIVLDWVNNTLGVSVLMVRPVAGGGCLPGW